MRRRKLHIARLAAVRQILLITLRLLFPTTNASLVCGGNPVWVDWIVGNKRSLRLALQFDDAVAQDGSILKLQHFGSFFHCPIWLRQTGALR